jgi:sulfite reductase (NADPH) hemoprotein beta-component
MNASPPSKNEILKAQNPSLAGTLAETLADAAADKFSEDDSQLLKFHGIYQQDDRDKRRFGRQFSVMVRTRQTGGVVTPEQYLVYDALADKFGNETLRLTTRQTLQFHGVLKGNLIQVVREINAALSTTLATAGDINRNVTAPPAPTGSPAWTRVNQDAFALTRALLPTHTAYHQIWLNGKKLPPEHPYRAPPAQEPLPTNATADSDALYGTTYLPRKFKIGFAIPPRNDTDVFTNDLGFIAIVDAAGAVEGYNVVVGGGMGFTHGNTATFPRLASPLGFLSRENLLPVALAAVRIHRDFGDRSNRRHARLKYLIEERGIAWFAAEIAQRANVDFAPPRPASFSVQGDSFGWHNQLDGKLFLTLFVETGRVKDAAQYALKTALRDAVSQFRPQLFLTPSQNIILGGIAPAQQHALESLLASHGISTQSGAISPLRGAGIACPALPTCGFALTEAERVYPVLVNELESTLIELGLDDEVIFTRMTGCPNGCARPRTAEIGFIGCAPNKYNLYLGGSHTGSRLNKLYRENVKFTEITDTLKPLLIRFKHERNRGEHFGDFVTRLSL